jgi:hypothetical protein
MADRTSINEEGRKPCPLHWRKSLLWGALLLASSLSFPVQAAKFELMEATISEINAAYENRSLTAERLVQMYLDRIEAYDKKGPKIRAMITVNPNALKEARALDKERQKKGPRSLLHGIPVIIKDNYDTVDMPTTAGSVLLKNSIPPDDAFIVKKLRDAGAVILGKANMSEFALSFDRLSHAGKNRRTASGRSRQCSRVENTPFLPATCTIMITTTLMGTNTLRWVRWVRRSTMKVPATSITSCG